MQAFRDLFRPPFGCLFLTLPWDWYARREERRLGAMILRAIEAKEDVLREPEFETFEKTVRA
jgi:hypothetical protein